MRFVNWIIETIAFYLKAVLFIGVLALLILYGTVHAALFGGTIMPDDAWFFVKILLLIFAPPALATLAWLGVRKIRKASAGAAFAIVLIFGYVFSIAMLGRPATLSNYTHAPQFWEAKLYSVENGKLTIPEENRELFMRDCGFISHEGMKDTCQIIVYCQSYDELAYERAGCDGLLMKKTSPALLDLALQERRDFEYDRRVRGE